jgi:uncharacterized protein
MTQKDTTHNQEYIFTYILLKLAARCNINCTYCYWFRDKSVYQKPAVLTLEAEKAFIEKLAAHIRKYHVKNFFILFHGGEPLLFGKQRFEGFCQSLRHLEEKLGFELKLAVTTNGILVDQEWARLFRTFRVGVTVSIDGPEWVHNKYRLNFQGHGTFHETITALNVLRSDGIEPGVIAVCNPHSDPGEICNFFVTELGIFSFDILIPDATRENKPPSIAHYYKKLFDLWYDSYAPEGVSIRFIESISKGLLGLESHSESIGYGPNTTFTMLTDGSLEPLDVLRITGDNSTKTTLNVFNHELQDIQTNPLWREVREASLNLAPICQECAYKFACGGGHIAHRWSKQNRYNNPSVYCEDLKQIFKHAWARIAADLYIQTPTSIIPFLEADALFKRRRDINV